MFRLGVFTGKIYTLEDYLNGAEECCIVVTHGTPEENEKYIEEIRIRNKQRCAGCNNCPEAKKSKGVNRHAIRETKRRLSKV